ncbi:MAG: MAPEG family protein [Rhodospirillaceae bacterium]|jgi:uncharacterized MAPEG superfamily protein|nr:MAPEG family protein [Rhodospirillaceae bacterium]MBT6511974.1 MAPEG family protein [Rhodospirillaceae bacterium]MBT7614359.1 MAPEG family protein [Rhodospirillaceae bacterium]MBT7647613.1 MAPEG family protein [Rhodospirillaceae bacterium]
MTPDLTYLALTALLTGLLWLPYMAGQITANGMMAPADFKEATARPVPKWAQRANRAHLNAIETLAPFAVLVLIAHVAGVADESTALWAAVFFWARVAHAVVYIAGIPYARSLAFAAGNVALILLFVAII